MAKTKLWLDLNRALDNLDATLGDVLQKMQCNMMVGEAQRKQLGEQYFALSSAAGAMTTHLGNLERRETSPTVGDRLRNLKNVLKDKEELKQQRKAIRQYFANMKDRIDKLKSQASQALNDIGTHDILVENRAAQH